MIPLQDNSMLPAGFRAAAVQCGIRPRRKRLDLGLVLADEACPAAAIYTTNVLQGAHIPVCQEHLARSGGMVRALLVNSGNANCSTGQAGIEDNRRVCRALAELIGCPPEQVLFLSTGVIGARLPVEKILEALPELLGQDAQQGPMAFTQSIMTTDLVPKLVARSCADSKGRLFRVTGIAKGSGMIHPNMATMLSFLLTDARCELDMRQTLQRTADLSYHRLTVDGDTSPNDTVVLWTSRRQEVEPSSALPEALREISQDLARRIAVDGEGATRLVTVEVKGAPTEQDAVLVGRTIATSPLTKTAVHGRDPNWGRILAAAGRAGIRFDAEKARVWIGSSEVYSLGVPHPENENAAHLHMLNEKEVVLGIDLALGSAEAQVWTCDFSADYVHINADYRS
ncbi:MAG: bifunctional glutamate N-acetyltransferase/amino-acid acetyltransferase ArgJ [Planctomycetota bacterium]|nr:MAG: bifunctional glutamate N-acetyltransferase/amino-acid acetyltransferase ArgJ [Planctomycetota bacterium]